MRSHRDRLINRLDQATQLPVNRYFPLEHLRALDEARRLIASMEDRRLYNPDPLRPARALYRRAARLTNVVDHAITGHKVRFLNSGLMFSEPFRVAICAKRKIRKEVLFAFRHGGKGGAKKQYRRNNYSGVRC